MNLNVALLRQIKDTIIDDPGKVDMRTFLSHWVGGYGEVGCIGGWACALSGLGAYNAVRSPQIAMELLGGEAGDEDTFRCLFYVTRWPEPFRSDMAHPESKEDEAAIVAARIEAFIEEHTGISTQ